MQPVGASNRRVRLFCGFALLLVVLQFLHLPENLSFTAFAFGEPGANLSAVYLIRSGLHPNVDFGHSYGLLGFLLSDFWFRFAQLTPLGYWSGILLIELAMCAVLAEFAAIADLSGLSLLFLLAAFPIFVWVNYFNFAHAIETLCLMAAVAAHSKGRYELALAAIGAAVLARPALGYVYGFCLVCIVMIKIFRAHSLRSSVFILPACTTMSLAIVLGWRFGVLSLMRTVLPTTGAANYSARGYGFFRLGMAFWLPSPFRLRFYLDVPGFWLLTCMTVMILGPVAILRARDADAKSLRMRTSSEVLGIVALVVFVWIFFAFSHQYIGSWILYLWLAVWGASLLPKFFKVYRFVVVVLVLLAWNADRHQIVGTLSQWRTARLSSLFAYTFSQPNEDEQLKEIFSAVRGRKTAVPIYSGAVPLLHSGLGEPVTEFFAPGIALAGDQSRMKSALLAADMVVVPTPPWYRSDNEFFSWTGLLDKQSSYRLVLRNPAGFVLARNRQDQPPADGRSHFSGRE